jgi:hypothetical protein
VDHLSVVVEEAQEVTLFSFMVDVGLLRDVDCMPRLAEHNKRDLVIQGSIKLQDFSLIFTITSANFLSNDKGGQFSSLPRRYPAVYPV